MRADTNQAPAIVSSYTEVMPQLQQPTTSRSAGLGGDALRGGDVIGNHRIISALGEGGMARVYVAHDEQLARKVALKVLPPAHADDEARARFLREAHALARVQHKNVVQVYASGTHGDTAWMSLELVIGDALTALVGAVDEESALALCAQAARGLAAAHAQGVVHRDIKPDNLILDGNSTLRVIDFGVAFMVDDGVRTGGFRTQTGVAVGTPHFMAPEQARGERVDAKTDAWGLGATLYALLDGRPPFFVAADEPDVEILARVLRDRAPALRNKHPHISPATSMLVAQLLEPDASKRSWDMEQLAHQMDAIADDIAAAATAAASPSDAAAAGAASADVAGPQALEVAPAPTLTANAGAPTWLWLAALAMAFAFLGAVVAVQWTRAHAPSPMDVPVARVFDPVVAPEQAPVVLPQIETPAPTTTPTPLTAVARAHVLTAQPAQHASEIVSLVRAHDADSVEVLRAVLSVGGAAQQLALDTVVKQGARHHVALVGELLKQADRTTAQRAIVALTELKSLDAVAMLDDAAVHHPDGKVRAAAAAARKQLFSAE